MYEPGREGEREKLKTLYVNSKQKNKRLQNGLPVDYEEVIKIE